MKTVELNSRFSAEAWLHGKFPNKLSRGGWKCSEFPYQLLNILEWLLVIYWAARNGASKWLVKVGCRKSVAQSDDRTCCDSASLALLSTNCPPLLANQRFCFVRQKQRSYMKTVSIWLKAKRWPCLLFFFGQKRFFPFQLKSRVKSIRGHRSTWFSPPLKPATSFRRALLHIFHPRAMRRREWQSLNSKVSCR